MDRAWRLQCQNSLVVSVILRGDMMNNLLCRIVVTVAEPVELWHGEQSQELRGSHASLKWLAQQHQGDFAAHVCSLARRLQQCEHLEFCRFDIPAPGINMDFDEGTTQDDLADTYGQMTIIFDVTPLDQDRAVVMLPVATSSCIISTIGGCEYKFNGATHEVSAV